MKHKRIYILFLIGWMMGLSLQAQNNPFGIDDGLYAYYMRCSEMLKDKRVMLMADTLFREAGRKGDVKAQCLAWHIKCDHYYFIVDIPLLQKTIKDAQKFIRKTPYHQYFFSTWLRLITYYEIQKDYQKALEEVQLFQKEAIQMDNAYGITMSYKHLANIYAQQRNYSRSLGLYKKALEYAISRNETKDLYGLYSNIGAIYSNLSLPDSAFFYYRETLKRAPDEARKISIYIRMEETALNAGHQDTAYCYIQKVERLRNKYPIYGTALDIHFSSMSEYCCSIKKYGKAMEYNDSIVNRLMWMKGKESIFQDMGNLEQAYNWSKRYHHVNDSVRIEEADRLLAELASRFDNERLHAEKDRLQMQAANLELEKEKDQRRLLELEKERNLLQLKNQELSLQQQKDELEQTHKEAHYQKERIKLMETRSRQNLITSVVLGILLFTVFTLALLYAISRRRSFKKLKRQMDIAEQARCEAENANRLKSLFLQNMSHEIRTPLNAIIGFTGVLNSEEDMDIEPEERKEMLGLIETNTELLTTLINDILDLSKLESNTYVLNLAPVDVSELCHSVIASMTHRLPSGVKLRLEEPDTAHLMTLNTDAARLQQVLNNFLTNACKYTDKGSITLAYRTLGNAIEFSVTDTGSGIPIGKAETIFERFEKLDNFKQGTGLGLNICRRIADLVGGRVYVDTSYTDGARFIFIYPIMTKEK